MGKGGGRLFAVIGITLLCCTGAAAADLLELQARSHITPANEDISIHDLFIMAADETAERISLASPRDLSAVCGSKAALVPLWQLKGVLDGNSNTVSVVGRRSVYIPYDTDSPSMQRLLEELLHLLRQEYPEENERVEIEIPRMPGGLQALKRSDKSQHGSIQAELLTLRETAAGTAAARFLVTAGDLQGVVSVDVNRFTPYLSPVRAAARGDTLDSNELKRKAFPAGKYPPALRSAENGSYEVQADISSGAALTVRNARVKPLVEPGDAVQVVLKRGAVQLKMPGNARGEGGMNEKVAVRLETGIVKECRVLAAGEVILE